MFGFKVNAYDQHINIKVNQSG